MWLERLGWQLLRPPKILYALGLGGLVGRLVLMLGTHGRRSGKTHWVPLQYERIEGLIVVASARGMAADWMRNAAANPRVRLRIGAWRGSGSAALIVDPLPIRAFLEERMRRHPRMMGLLFRLEGLPPQPQKEDLERIARRIALLAISPDAPLPASIS